jgi:hypothetical protein
MVVGGDAVCDSTPINAPPTPGPGDLATLLERAREGDGEALSTLRTVVDSTPGLWAQLGDLARLAEQAWIDLIAGSDPLFREALERRIKALQAELSGADPSPLVRLLARRVVASWLQLQQADAACAQAINLPIRQAVYLEKRQGAAHRRHLAAVAALATVRRLVPANEKSSAPADAARASSVSSGDGDISQGLKPTPMHTPVPNAHVPLTLFNATANDPPCPTPAGRTRKTRRSTAS